MQFDDRPDDGGSKYLWNVCKFLSDYTAQQVRRQTSSSWLHTPITWGCFPWLRFSDSPSGNAILVSHLSITHTVAVKLATLKLVSLLSPPTAAAEALKGRIQSRLLSIIFCICVALRSCLVSSENKSVSHFTAPKTEALKCRLFLPSNYRKHIRLQISDNTILRKYLWGCYTAV
jgi:hypothetical protein